MKFKTLEQMKRDHIQNVYIACDMSKNKAARVLGISSKTLYNMIDRLGPIEEWGSLNVENALKIVQSQPVETLSAGQVK